MANLLKGRIEWDLASGRYHVLASFSCNLYAVSHCLLNLLSPSETSERAIASETQRRTPHQHRWCCTRRHPNGQGRTLQRTTGPSCPLPLAQCPGYCSPSSEGTATPALTGMHGTLQTGSEAKPPRSDTRRTSQLAQLAGPQLRLWLKERSGLLFAL